MLEQFLPSVVEFSDEATIYVADNASTDDSIEVIKSSDFINNIFKQLEIDFEFNVAVLGARKVGKTSLIKSIVRGTFDLLSSQESEQKCYPRNGNNRLTVD